MSLSMRSPSNPIDGTRLLLGWQHETPNPFGFGRVQAPMPTEGEAIEYDQAAHLISVAPTRSGKGRGVIVPNLLKYRGPAVILDPKGENYQVSARARREMGQRVVRLDPFHVVLDGSDAFNLFDIFKLPGADVVSDAQMLAHLIATGNLSSREPFWDLNGCGLLAGVMAYVAVVKEPAERNLGEVCRILSSDDVVYNLAVVLDTVGKQLPRHAYQEIASFLQMPEITRGGVLATVESYLKPLMSERVEATLAQSSFDIADVVSNGLPCRST